jgi:hypothetical protein
VREFFVFTVPPRLITTPAVTSIFMLFQVGAHFGWKIRLRSPNSQLGNCFSSKREPSTRCRNCWNSLSFFCQSIHRNATQRISSLWILERAVQKRLCEPFKDGSLAEDCGNPGANRSCFVGFKLRACSAEHYIAIIDNYGIYRHAGRYLQFLRYLGWGG